MKPRVARQLLVKLVVVTPRSNCLLVENYTVNFFKEDCCKYKLV